MLYHAYELGHAAVAPWRDAIEIGKHFFDSPYNPVAQTWMGKNMSAACDLFESLTRRYGKPTWGLNETTVNDYPIPVNVRAIWQQPFCRLLHFERDADAMEMALESKSWQHPRVLIVAPLSGHYATLLRGTVEAFLPDHEVYVTDWADARQVPLPLGRFDLNDYIDYVMDMMAVVGPEAHVIGVCQPGPPVLAAIALMSDQGSDYLPASMTFLGSPIDPRQSPTVPNELAMERSYDWFRNNVIYSVPFPNRGVMRRVYPGFMQLGGFITMNQEKHVSAHQDYFEHLVFGDDDSAQKHREFYDEYLSVLDLTEEFYLQTIRDVFQEFKLPLGKLRHRGELVKPSAISEVALMTIEGEKDDISGIGQTQAAHDLCSRLPESMRRDYIQPGVGHYGVFSGKRYRSEIQPRIRQFIRDNFNEKHEQLFQDENRHLVISR